MFYEYLAPSVSLGLPIQFAGFHLHGGAGEKLPPQTVELHKMDSAYVISGLSTWRKNTKSSTK